MNQPAESSDLHRAVVDAVREKVRDDRYPSLQQLDLLEQYADDRERAALVQTVLDKVRAESYPSPPMLRRLMRLAG